MDPEAALLAQELLENAARQSSSFSSFFNVWGAFNGWMDSVTEEYSDAAMINALAENRRATEAYELLLGEHRFRRRLNAFVALWPVLNVRDVRRKLGRDAFWELDREDLIAACQREGVKHQPENWQNDQIPTWSQLLRAIYLVRCNLFHGMKSPQAPRDRDLVLHSERILRMYIEQSDCFRWED